MRILFSVRNAAYVRHYDAVIRELARRGHTIDLALDGSVKLRPWPAHVEQIARDHPNVRLGHTPSVRLDPWYELATAVRQNLFHARFLEPEYRDTPALLTRAAEKAPGFARALLESAFGRVRPFRAAVTAGLRAIERATPIPGALIDDLRARRPDVVVLTPLVVLRTSQLDLLRAARCLGIPTVFAVASWDHLSSKGLVHELPDRVLVWNDVQRQEAERLHGVPAGRIVVTGAQVFDEWFDREPSQGRDAFCRMVGLPPDRPYVLYVGSALFEGSPDEAQFARRWIEAVRTRRELADLGILVRPHFKRGDEWASLEQAAIPNVRVWPPLGEAPVDAGSRATYVDSLSHAAAVVGLNTSALIEAAIRHKPVLTVLLPEFYANQEGTLHFRYLSEGPPPLLHAARDLDAHAAQLAGVLTGADPDPDRSRRFVRHFVRPGHPGTPATLNVVEAIEAAASPAPAPAPGRTRVPRSLLAPLARAAVRRTERQREEREQVRARRHKASVTRDRPRPPRPARKKADPSRA